MAAQGPKPETRYCDKCFALIPADAEFCPECGVTIPTGGYTEGSDAEVYPELTRANLLRMRSEYRQAEDVCLAILRRFPNNAGANVLLGDIAAEKGELDHALQWYDLARDIQPDSATLVAKHEAVKQRKQEHEAATTAKQLGLPTSKPKGVAVAVGLLIFIACVGVTAYYMGRGYTPPRRESLVDVPIDVPGEIEPATVSEQKTPVTTPPVSTAQPAPAGPRDDRELLEMLTRKLAEGSRLTGAELDPRSKDATVTFQLQAGEDERVLAAQIGASVFDVLPDSGRAIVRAVRGGRLVLVGDVSRADVQTASSAEWREENGAELQTWVAAVLKNVWHENAP